MSLYMSSGEQGRPCIRVQGWVDVLCLLPSPKLSRLPSCPQRGFQLQTSLRPDKVVTALLLGLWIHSRVGRGFAGTLAEGQNANRALEVLVQVKHVAFQRVAPHTPHPTPLVLLPTPSVFQELPAFTVPGAELCKMPVYPTKK